MAFVGLQQLGFGIQNILGAWFSLHSKHLRSQRKGVLQFASELGVFIRGILLCADLDGRAVQGVGLRPLAW